MTDSPHVVTVSTTIPNARTLDTTQGVQASVFEAIVLPDDTTFPDGSSAVLIRDTYKTFWDLLSHDEKDWERRHCIPAPFLLRSHATVISGQPGIGK